MTYESETEITRLLAEARDGSGAAFNRLFSRVYAELRRLASSQLRRERGERTLCATALVHEAWLKLAGSGPVEWRSRPQFFAIAARAMRQIAVDHARRRLAGKRGGDLDSTTLTDGQATLRINLDEVLALDQALDRLDQMDSRLRSVIEYRFFCGLGPDEVAALLGVSERSVQRDWIKARAWLYKELYPEPPAGRAAGR